VSGYDLLTDEQQLVARSVLAEEASHREHLVVYLSGAHAYGFPSPDSDLDLKAIHVGRTASLVGLHSAKDAHDRAEVKHGVEIDYTSNEVKQALLGVLLGSGNMIERLLGVATLEASSDLESLRPLVRGALCRRVHRHYRGFARSQLREAEKKPTVKKVLYVLRTALTGTHLLASGEVVTDVTTLLDAHRFGAARELVEAKRKGEKLPMSEDDRARWASELERALALLDAAAESSPLPEEPPNEADLDAWLRDLRRRRW
jgi:predicted nucleotidyltransferase